MLKISYLDNFGGISKKHICRISLLVKYLWLAYFPGNIYLSQQ